MVKVTRRKHLRKHKQIHRTRKRNIRRRVKKTQRKIKRRRRRTRRRRQRGGAEPMEDNMVKGEVQTLFDGPRISPRQVYVDDKTGIFEIANVWNEVDSIGRAIDNAGGDLGKRVKGHFCNELLPFSVEGPKTSKVTGDLQKIVGYANSHWNNGMCAEHALRKDAGGPLTNKEEATITMAIKNRAVR